ncbi:MAG: DUF4336 domain-containing protein [Pseudomonadota bacterium]
MLEQIAPDLWHAGHAFKLGGATVTTRMTVVRLADGKLWLHSPVPLSAPLRAQLDALGEVAYIVAPSKMHHLYLSACAAAYPSAQLFGAPGLAKKRPDVAGLRTLGPASEAGWAQDLDQLQVRGLPLGNEVLWLHKASRTLIVTDLCQHWQGELPFASLIYATLTGVRKRLAVPYTVRLMVKDKQAMAETARQILLWPFERVVVAHNAIVERDAHAEMTRALSVFRS